MTEKQAIIEGLGFTGIYSSYNLEDVKARAATIRKAGFRAVLVTTSGERGLSVYAEDNYFKAVHVRATWEDSKRKLKSKYYTIQIESLKNELEKMIQEKKEAENLVLAGEPVAVR
jgi:hypothetical protein